MKQGIIPTEFQTPEAKQVFQWLIERGIVDEEYMPTNIIQTKTLKVYLAKKINKEAKLHTQKSNGVCWRPFEELWGIRHMPQTNRKMGRPIGYKIVDDVFKEFKPTTVEQAERKTIPSIMDNHDIIQSLNANIKDCISARAAKFLKANDLFDATNYEILKLGKGGLMALDFMDYKVLSDIDDALCSVGLSFDKEISVYERMLRGETQPNDTSFSDDDLQRIASKISNMVVSQVSSDITNKLAKIITGHISEANLNGKEVLTAEETAQYMGVSMSYLYKLTMKKQIPHYKPLGKMCFFNRKEVEDWIQRNRIATDEELNQMIKTFPIKTSNQQS